MSKKAAAQAVADAELRALVAEQDARHALAEEQDRQERQRLFAQFRQELARDRLEAQAQAVEAAAVTPPVTPAATQPWDERTGRWLPAAPRPEPEVEPEPDVAGMSLGQYAASRSALGVHDAPSAGPSRRPGYTTATNRGMFDGLPGYVDPRSANKTVFRSQLEDQRKPVPVGFVRPDTGEWL